MSPYKTLVSWGRVENGRFVLGGFTCDLESQGHLNSEASELPTGEGRIHSSRQNSTGRTEEPVNVVNSRREQHQVNTANTANERPQQTTDLV